MAKPDAKKSTRIRQVGSCGRVFVHRTGQQERLVFREAWMHYEQDDDGHVYLVVRNRAKRVLGHFKRSEVDQAYVEQSSSIVHRWAERRRPPPKDEPPPDAP